MNKRTCIPVEVYSIPWVYKSYFSWSTLRNKIFQARVLLSCYIFSSSVEQPIPVYTIQGMFPGSINHLCIRSICIHNCHPHELCIYLSDSPPFHRKSVNNPLPNSKPSLSSNMERPEKWLICSLPTSIPFCQSDNHQTVSFAVPIS